MRYLEDIVVGEVTEYDATYAVTEEEIREVGRRWDPQPFHTDPEAAAASPFGGLVASSVHLFAITVCLGVAAEPTAAVSSLGFRTMDNHAPVRPGDVLTVRNTNLATRLSRSKPGLGVFEARCELLNQRGEVVFSFENAALVECRSAAAPEAGG